MQKRVRCPHCGYMMPLVILPGAQCYGITARCKNKNCKKEFEVKVKEGMQSR